MVVPAGVQAGQRGPDGDGLAGTDLTGDHPEGAFGMHQPIRATASAWAVWRCSICGASARPNGHPGEAVVGLQILDGHRGPCLLSSLLVRGRRVRR